jgi:hypothetical protein
MPCARILRTAAWISAVVTGAGATAQEAARPTEAEVRAVLDAWEADHMLVSLSRAADKMLVDVGSSLSGATRARVSIALTDAFSADRLRASLSADLLEHAEADELAALGRWLLAEEFRGIRARMNPDAMPASFQEYAAYLRANPAPPARFDLVARLVFAQAAGELFVLTTDRLRASIEAVVDEAGGPGSAVRVQLSAEREQDRLEDVHITTFISLLRRLEPLSDPEARRLLDAYASESGQWWVSTYQHALLAAIDAAAERARGAFR